MAFANPSFTRRSINGYRHHPGGYCAVEGAKPRSWLSRATPRPGTSPNANAETIIISCRNKIRDYQISFNTINGILIKKVDANSTQFNIREVAKNDDWIYVWGNTKDYGNDYLLKIGNKISIKYFYSNNSTLEDSCI
ncbi:MAG: hypothetical protein WCI28_12470, partial [Opitutaceae bacterium]